MHAPAVPLPCPGQPSPVRPVALVPVCKGCPLWQRFAELDAHQRPVAYHDGTRWVCERRPVSADARDEPPLDAACHFASGLAPAPAGAGGVSSS